MKIDRVAPIAALALAGCSLIYDPDDVEAPPSRTEVGAFVEAWLDAYLASAATCYVAPEAWVDTFEIRDRSAHADVMMDLWDRGTRRFDAEAAAACLAATLAPAGCDALLETRSPPPDHPCALALRGARGVGEACGAHGDCEPSLYCDGSAGVCPGTCAPRGQLGSNCTNGALACQRQLGCFNQPSSGSSYCRSRQLPQGSPCTNGEGGCAFGLYCDSGTTHCEIAPATAGTACGGGWACAMGFHCDGGSSTCQPQVPLAGSCVPGVGECATGSRCSAAGTCEPNVGVGAECGDLGDGAEYQDCLGGWCDGTTCQPFPVRGEAATAPCAPANLGVGAVGGVCAFYCT